MREFNGKQAAQELTELVGELYPEDGDPKPDSAGSGKARCHYAGMKSEPIHGIALSEALDAAEAPIRQAALALRQEARARQHAAGKLDDPEWNLTLDALDLLLIPEQALRYLQATALAVSRADRPGVENGARRNAECRMLLRGGTANAAGRLLEDARYAASAGAGIHTARNADPAGGKAYGGAEAHDAVLQAKSLRELQDFTGELRREQKEQERLAHRFPHPREAEPALAG